MNQVELDILLAVALFVDLNLFIVLCAIIIQAFSTKCKYRKRCFGYTPDTYVCDYAPDDYDYRCFKKKGEPDDSGNFN
jgi:hypothetical protein